VIEAPDRGTDTSSRRHAFIDRSVDWIVDAAGLAAGDSVLDLGCGPGLYATRTSAAAFAGCVEADRAFDASDTDFRRRGSARRSDLPRVHRAGRATDL